jgi:8-oxo-dGTP pyrophosphatase MutT (NUDIX family)
LVGGGHRRPLATANPVDDRLMDRLELQHRLRAACIPVDEVEWLPEPAGSAAGAAPADETPWLLEGIPAAVLIGLVAHPEGPGIILTERTAHLANHAAEVSLPGGRVEADDEGPAAAALREACEEIGLDPGKVELLGCLPPCLTVSGFCVYPFVGWIEPPVELTPDPYEVADIFEVPLGFILDPANQQRGSLVVGGVRHEFYVLPYPGHRVWGATAGILLNLARALVPA